MSREIVTQMIDRWMNEPAFKDELKSDPSGTVAKYGYALDNDEMAALLSLDLSLSDSELQERVSKRSGCGCGCCC